MSETDTIDPSSSAPMVTKWSDEWWATKAKPTARRCTAHSTRTGNRCGRAACEGANVCMMHGGKAPQVKRKARQRLEEAADRMAKELLKIASDPNASEAVRVNAIKDALDRAGIQAKTAVDVSVTAKPYETIFEQIEMEGGSRAEHRRANGFEDSTDALVESQREPSTADDEPIEVEIVGDFSSYAQPITPDDDESGSALDSAGQSPFAASPAPDGLMPLDEAVSAQAQVRAQGQPGHAVSHRAQRALPPGRSSR